MADRYWVGGTGNWSDTAHWSTASGATGGASLPTSSDDVFIDSNSGFGSGGTLSETGTAVCRNFTANSGHSYNVAYVNSDISIYGSAVFESGLNWTQYSYTQFRGSTVGATITTNGCVFRYVSLYGTGDWTLVGDMVITDISSTAGVFEFQKGTFDANGYDVSADQFTISAGAGYAPTLIMGSGTFEATYVGSQTFWQVTEGGGEVVTIVPGTSTIKYASTANYNMTFHGGSKTYNNLVFDRGASTGLNYVWGSNTFNTLSDLGTAAHSLKFQASSTTHVTTFDVSGSAGRLITIDSSSASTHALVKDGGGLVRSDYLNIQHSVATPSNTWFAGFNSIDNQAVSATGSGWIFTSGPTNQDIIPSMNLSDTRPAPLLVAGCIPEVATIINKPNLSWHS